MLRPHQTSRCQPPRKAVHKPALPGDNKEQLFLLFHAPQTYPTLSPPVPGQSAYLSTGFVHTQGTEAKNDLGLIPRFGAALLLPTM